GPVTADALWRCGKRPASALVARGDGDLPTPDDVEQIGEVHVHSEGQRCVAPGEPARRDEHVVDGRRAQAAELLRNGGGEVAASLDRGEALEGKAAVAVVRGRLRADLLDERLRERDEARTGL